MQITDASTLKAAVQVDVQKKAENVVKNVIGGLLEKSFENTMKVEQMAAASTGKGININVKA